jgi:hypothetical protein
MRYSIMLQLVAGTTLILVGGAALFGWMQNRTEPVKFRTHPVSSGANRFSIDSISLNPAAIATRSEIARVEANLN